MKLTRREAIVGMATGGLLVGCPFLLKANGSNAAQTGGKAAIPSAVQAIRPDLSVVTGRDPAQNVRAAVEALGGMGRFVGKGDIVTLKPNMGFGNAPEAATTTDPRVVRAMAELALNAGAKRVLIYDYPCNKADIVLDVCGIKKIMAGLDDTFVYTIQSAKYYSEVTIPNAKTLYQVPIARDILESDCIINMPVAKSHGSAKVSFGMKNWMGIVENRKTWHFSHDLNTAIADIATFVRPKLTLLDATRALVTGGPGGPGEIQALNTVVAGTDPVALDAYGLTLAPFGGKGYKPTDINYLVDAAKRGVGTIDLEKLTVQKQII